MTTRPLGSERPTRGTARPPPSAHRRTAAVNARQKSRRPVRPEELAAFAEVAQVAVLVAAKDRILFASEQAERMLGYARGSLIGKSVASLVAPEEVPRLRRLRRARERQRARGRARLPPLHLEIVGARQNGERIWVDTRVSGIDWNGKSALLGLLTDISARKRAEQALHDSERRYRLLIESSVQGMVVVQDSKVVMANRAFAQMFGYGGPRGVSAGTAFTDFLAPRERPRFLRMHRRRTAGSPLAPQTEYEGRRRDGSPLWFQSTAQRVEWGGRPAVQETIQDITERRRSEAELRASQSLLQTIFETIPARLFVTDENGRYLKVNPEQARALGLKPADLVGKPNTWLLGRIGIRAAQVRTENRTVLKAGERIEVPARRFLAPDGSERWTHIIKVPIRSENGRIAGQLVLLMDVTQRERAQRELHASQRLLQSVFDAIPERLFVKDRSGRYLKINAAQAKAFGIPDEEAPNLTTEEIGVRIGANSKDIMRQDAYVLRTGRRLEIPEQRRRLADGRERWYRVIKVPLRDERRRIAGIVGLAMDVTERRNAEEALRASDQLLKTVFDALPVGVFIKDREGRYVRVNRQQARYYGLSADQFRGRHWEELAPLIRGDIEAARRQDKEVLNEGARVDITGAEFENLEGRRYAMRMIKVPLRDASGAIVGLVGMSIDITRQREAEEALRASEQLLQTVFDAIPEPLFVKDRQGRFLKVNTELARIYGVKPAAMVGKPWAYVGRVGADPKTVQAEDEEVMRTGKRVEIPDTTRQTRSGPRWFRFIKVPLKDASGQVAGMIGLAQDVTERRQAEQALQAQQRLLRTVFDAMPVRITVKDTAGKFLMVNRAHSDTVEQAAEAMLGHTVDQLEWIPEWRRKLYLGLEAEVLRTKRQIEVPEVNMDTPARTRGTFRMVKVPILDGSGDVEGIVTMWEDINARLAADQEIRRSRRLLQTVFDAIPLEISVKDASGRYLAINRAYARRFAVQPDTIVGSTTETVSHFSPSQREAVRAADLRVLETKALVEMTDVDESRPDRGPFTHRLLKVPLLDENGRPEGIVTLAEDISDRIAGEQELRRSRLLLQAVLDIIPHSVFVRDLDGRHLLVNAADARQLGVRAEDMIGRPLADLPLDSEVIERWVDQDKQVIETGETLDLPDSIFMRGDGTEMWLHAVKLPLREDTGKVIAVVGLAEDITARKRAELALQENQRLLEEAQAVGHTGSWSVDTGRPGSLRWSPEVFRIFGLPQEGFTGTAEPMLNLIHPDDGPRFQANLQHALKGEGQYESEHRIVRPDGSVRWVHERADVHRDPAGRATRMVGFIQDITERKTAELALVANQRLLQAVLDAIPHNLFVKDRNSRIVLVNRALNAFWRITGPVSNLETTQLPGLTQEVAEAWLRADRKVIETGQPVEAEGDEVRLLSGRRAILRSIKVPWRDERNQIIGLVGLSEDITARVDTEAALRSHQQLIQAVFDTIPHGVFVKDRNSSYVLANSGFASFHGLSPDQLKGLPTRMLPGLSQESADTWIEQDRQVIDTGEPVRLEYKYVSADKEETWFDLRKFPWRDDDGRVVGVVGVRENITERRRTEEIVRANRRLLRTVFDTIPHMLYVKDAESRYIMVNEALARLYNTTPDMMAGRGTLDMPGAIEDQREDLLADDREVIRTGEPVYRPDVPIYEGAGGTHWYSIIKLPLRDEDGRTVGIVGMSEDITERRSANLELQTNRRLLRAVFDAVPFWLMVRDQQGRATLANRRIAEDYGVTPDDFIGKTMQDDPYLRPEEKAAMAVMNEKVRKTHRPALIPEISLTLPGDRARLMRLAVIPFFDDEGRREGELILAEDITDQKRSERALLQAQKLESLGVLAGGVAHDFNNLLVAILGNASLALLKLKEGTAGREELKQIEVAGQRAAELCRQMLAYAGKGPLEMQRVDVNTLVHEMTQLLRVSLPKGVTVSFRLASDIPVVRGDPTQIRQIVMNLVINAGEAIGDRQGIITILTGSQIVDKDYLDRCQAAPDAEPGTYVFLEISDTGQGMNPEIMARIFDPFFTTKFTGRGLGLASVIGIVRGHRGALRVYSEVGKGAAFRILLPAASPPFPDPQTEPELQAWNKGGMVLVVDDEAEIRSVAERMLTHLGFRVLTAAGGKEALAALKTASEPLQAALIDLTMPDMSGEEVVREIRNFQEHLAVLVMSGYSESDMQSRFAGRQRTEFLQKPFNLATLHAKMRALLGHPAQG